MHAVTSGPYHWQTLNALVNIKNFHKIRYHVMHLYNTSNAHRFLKPSQLIFYSYISIYETSLVTLEKKIHCTVVNEILVWVDKRRFYTKTWEKTCQTNFF